MKICPNCNNAVGDSAIFCHKCGLRIVMQNPTTNYPQQPQYNYDSTQLKFQNTPQTPSKNKNIGMIIGIAVVVLIVLAFIGSVAEKVFQEQGYGDDSVNSLINDSTNATTDDNASNMMDYDKGSLKDGWYINDWANMRFDINGWTLATDDMLAVFERNSKIECGLLINNEKTDATMFILFENLNGQTMSETEYINIIKNNFIMSNPDVEVNDGYTTKIANKDFQTLKCSESKSETDHSVQAYVYEQDGYMIVVIIEAFSDFDLSSVINNIRTVD